MSEDGTARLQMDSAKKAAYLDASSVDRDQYVIPWAMVALLGSFVWGMVLFWTAADIGPYLVDWWWPAGILFLPVVWASLAAGATLGVDYHVRERIRRASDGTPDPDVMDARSHTRDWLTFRTMSIPTLYGLTTGAISAWQWQRLIEFEFSAQWWIAPIMMVFLFGPLPFAYLKYTRGSIKRVWGDPSKITACPNGSRERHTIRKTPAEWRYEKAEWAFEIMVAAFIGGSIMSGWYNREVVERLIEIWT